MAKRIEDLQKSLQVELDSYKAKNKEYRKLISKRNVLEAQSNDLEMVMKELKLLKEGDEIYKLTGPVLLKQDFIEAKETVKKRMEFVKAETNRVEDGLLAADKAQSEHRDKLTNLQKSLQELSAGST